MNPALVKIDVASATLGQPARLMFDLIDGPSQGEAALLWVFNLARDLAGRRRDLRFWMPELAAHAARQPDKYNNHGLREVIAEILPGERQSFNAGNVDLMFQIRPRTRLDYGAELPCQRVAGRSVYARAGLEAFLCRRWIGTGEKDNHV